MKDTPLKGIRVLSMEQAVALPFGTRHLADLGAEVIRVQSHKRRAPGLAEIDLTRNKRQLAIDLATPGGPEAFLRVAAKCDVVAHNYTPRVVRQFGIDYEAVRRVRPDIIYVSLTGFGTTGPWGERPLFGPGAEAVSGHNLLIGDPDGWPGRPGTIVYSDSVCGLNAAFAVLAAIDHRDRTGEGQHIDISLYETAVSHLGPVMAERQLGAEPRRFGNADANYAIHGVFACAGLDQHVAIAATAEQLPALGAVLGPGVTTPESVQAATATRDATEVANALQGVGIPATRVYDASDTVEDEHMWSRDYFGLVERHVKGIEGTYPHGGPAWGHGAAVPIEESRPLGADTKAILSELAGYSQAEIDDLYMIEAVGTLPAALDPPGRETNEVRIMRGELSRVDPDHEGWRALAVENAR